MRYAIRNHVVVLVRGALQIQQVKSSTPTTFFHFHKFTTLLRVSIQRDRQGLSLCLLFCHNSSELQHRYFSRCRNLFATRDRTPSQRHRKFWNLYLKDTTAV